MTTSICPSYYDIDAILAEEELIPVNNLLDFSYLAHLDPDYTHHTHISSSPPPTNNATSTSPRKEIEQMKQTHMLPENTRFKMPLWSIDKWSKLNYIRLSLPKHYNRKGREKLDADPSSVDLRKKSERFYLSGMALINLIHSCVQGFHAQQQQQQSQNRMRSTSNNNNPESISMNNLHKESQELKQTLLITYTGERLRRIFDWTMSLIDDDVSSFTKKLTVMEETLFQYSAASSHAFAMWKLHGSRRICVSETALKVGTTAGWNDSCTGQMKDAVTSATTPGGTSKRSFSSSFSSKSRLISPGDTANNNHIDAGGRKRMRGH